MSQYKIIKTKSDELLHVIRQLRIDVLLVKYDGDMQKVVEHIERFKESTNTDTTITVDTRVFFCRIIKDVVFVDKEKNVTYLSSDDTYSQYDGDIHAAETVDGRITVDTEEEQDHSPQNSERRESVDEEV